MESLVPVRCCWASCTQSQVDSAYLGSSLLPIPPSIFTHICIPALSISHSILCPPLPTSFCSLLPYLGLCSTHAHLLSIIPSLAQIPPLSNSLLSLAELRMTPSLCSSPFKRVHIKIMFVLWQIHLTRGFFLFPGNGAEFVLESWYLAYDKICNGFLLNGIERICTH